MKSRNLLILSAIGGGILALGLARAMAPALAQHDDDDDDEHHVEIEVVGQLRHAMPVTKVIVFAQPKPCQLTNLAQASPIGIDTLDRENAQNTFAFEAVIETEEKPYVCAVGLDDQGRVIAYGGYEASPVRVERTAGEEYGRAHGLEVVLGQVSPPVPLDNALLSHYGT